MSTKQLAEVQAERDYQTGKWGTSFDDQNTPHQWMAYISSYGSRHLAGNPALVDRAAFREDMKKVAALAVAAMEAFDRANTVPA
jgi:hypothetical protein